MLRLCALAALAAGCHADIGNATADASGGGKLDGRGSDGAGAGTDAAPACANGRVVYLNFEGATLTQASASDATTNTASWIGVATATVPRYRSGDNNRMGEISNIVGDAEVLLAGTPIKIVTARPASGPYVMIVFGGAKADVGTVYTYATNEHDCGDTVKNDIGWISDAPPVGYVPDLVIGTIGWGLGMNGTTAPQDCMCAWASTCTPAGNTCTLASSIATGTLQAPATTCPNQDPQNEVAAFSTGFCQ